LKISVVRCLGFLHDRAACWHQPVPVRFNGKIGKLSFMV
jgi:hypothetical protein